MLVWRRPRSSGQRLAIRLLPIAVCINLSMGMRIKQPSGTETWLNQRQPQAKREASYKSYPFRLHRRG